jgi:hypothetical protein
VAAEVFGGVQSDGWEGQAVEESGVVDRWTLGVEDGKGRLLV